LQSLILRTSLLLLCACGALAQSTTYVSPQYVGPGLCASSSCHGSVQPRSDNRIPQNEYSIWVLQDKHAKAYNMLSSPLSQRMARNLGMTQKPAEAAECLGCHALNVPVAKRARSFDLTDGVSCENCHGPASNWLGPHTARNWKHEQSVAAGMSDAKNLIKRSEICLSCHIGTAEQSVTHEMIAAGHPDLVFELDSYSAVMPRHWKEPLDKDPGRAVRTWSVGQAVQLREALARLARRARSSQWPEYAEYDCSSCHHALTKPEDSWRQLQPASDRKPGTPPWNTQGYVVFRHLLHEIDASSADQFDAELKALQAKLNRSGSDRQQIAEAAEHASAAAGQLAQRLSTQPYSREFNIRVLRGISNDAAAISASGERSAEQAVMAVDSLTLACTPPLPDAGGIQASVTSMFNQLQNPSAYNAKTFEGQLRTVGRQLP
jgi:hypothetical protein